MVYMRHKHLLLYGLLGIIAIVIDFTVYSIILYYSITNIPEIANIIANAVAFLFSFYSNTFWNFSKKDKIFKRFLLYALVCTIGSLISVVIISLSKEEVGLYYSKMIALAVSCSIQYLLNKKITYSGTI